MTTINYGDKIKLVNQYTSKPFGYLDSYGNLGILGGAQAYGVQTSANPDRDGGSGTWQVVRDDLTSGSGPVSYGDKIKLVNQYTDETAVPNAGYLDSYGNLGILGGARAFGVQTSAKPNRDGGTGTWQVVPNSKSEITVAADQVAKLLSCSEGGGVDLWSHNDLTGRQFWHFQKTEKGGKGNVYNILVSGGTNQDETFLSTYSNGSVELFSHDDDSGRQQWELVIAEADPEAEISDKVAYNIKVFGGTDFGKNYLSCSPSGRVDLWGEDDNSGRQKWLISNFDEWWAVPRVDAVEGVIVIESIDWVLLFTLPANVSKVRSSVVGRTDKKISNASSSKSFSFSISAGFEGFGASVATTASTSLNSSLSETTETTMNTQETITTTYHSSPTTTFFWCLTMTGVLLADSLRYSVLPLLTCPATPRKFAGKGGYTYKNSKHIVSTDSLQKKPDAIPLEDISF